MAETESIVPPSDTNFDFLGRLFSDQPGAIRPTREEEITALRLLVKTCPALDLHRKGLELAGLRPAAVEVVLDTYLARLYQQIACLEGREPDTLRRHNVVQLPTKQNGRKPKNY